MMWSYYPLIGVMLVCAPIDILGTKYVDLINKICIYWTTASAVVIFTTLLLMEDTVRGGEFVFPHFYASTSGWPNGWPSLWGCFRPPIRTYGDRMVPPSCEEVQQPQHKVPRTMVLPVAAAGMRGVYLVPILFILPNVEPLLEVVYRQLIGL